MEVSKEDKVKLRNDIELNKNVIIITSPIKPNVITNQAKNRGKIYINVPAKLDLIAFNNP
mgnify:CR=1 FL=1|tara:strand:- start:10 stop:189 length:180 start_codon:yes stop_codon:yes gene_type:complete